MNKTVAAPILREKLTAFNNYVSNPENINRIAAETSIRSFGGIELPLDAITLTETVSDPYLMEKSDKQTIEVYINKNISRDLELEGLSREIIRRIQVMRKESLLQYNDEIQIFYIGDKDIEEAINIHAKKIAFDAQAKSIVKVNELDGRNWDIDGKSISIKIEKC